ncbi:WhiB family transcriptional regulator [Streptomyces sp. NPDC093589]|uniref:WhiB family transcriptional regulator n=1 Tax=Streptomyces sp. NPDC093589 TaxID=3366043 RepID=UPI00382D36AD
MTITDTSTGRPRKLAVTARNWRDYRACDGQDPDLFAADDKSAIDAAKAICADCPAKAFCLQFAIDSNSQYGVYGGTDEKERRALSTPQGQRTIPEMLDEIVACRRQGMGWERVAAVLGLPAGTLRKRVDRWMDREKAAGRTVPVEVVERVGGGLSREQVLDIRRRAAAGEADSEQSLRTGMSKSAIRRVASGERYPQFGGPLRAKRQGHASQPKLASCTEFNNGRASYYTSAAVAS